MTKSHPPCLFFPASHPTFIIKGMNTISGCIIKIQWPVRAGTLCWFPLTGLRFWHPFNPDFLTHCDLQTFKDTTAELIRFRLCPYSIYGIFSVMISSKIRAPWCQRNSLLFKECQQRRVKAYWTIEISVQFFWHFFCLWYLPAHSWWMSKVKMTAHLDLECHSTYGKNHWLFFKYSPM